MSDTGRPEMQPQTAEVTGTQVIEAALVEALWDLPAPWTTNSDPVPYATRAEFAAAILATPTGSELARLAEVGQAVERLPVMGGITRHSGFWLCQLGDTLKTAETPDAAIAAALGEEP
jgi:hypothetical protein